MPPTEKIAVPPKTPLGKARVLFKHWLHLPDSLVLDFVFGVVFANRLGGDPVWGGIIGPPGDGKTEILRSISGPDFVALSKLTPRTLVSGLRKGVDCKDEPSLLPKLDGKLLIIKDLTPVIDGAAEARAEILGQFRDAYDGSMAAAYGTGEHKEFKARFGLLFACTPVIERCWPIIASLGERFLYYRTPVGDDLLKVRAAVTSAHLKDEMRAELGAASEMVLGLDVPADVPCPDELRDRIVHLADFVAKARTPVKRNGYTEEPDCTPVPEVGTRLAGQLIQLARGISVARNLTACHASLMPVILHVAESAIPSARLNVLRGMTRMSGPLTTQELGGMLRMTTGMCHRAAEDLWSLGLLERHGGDGTSYRYTLSKLARERLAASGLLQPRGEKSPPTILREKV